MFKLTRPCVNCPFRKGQGELFGMHRLRLRKIFDAVAFPCHKTIDYGASSGDSETCEETKYKNDRPQQCAGLMSLLHREGRDNQIMQAGQRLGFFDPAALDHSDVYETIAACESAHGATDDA